MMPQTVTIAITCAKSEERLEDTFESLFDIKERFRVDVLYIDQAANSSLLNLAKSYGARILKITSGNPYSSRIKNEAVRHAKADFIFFIEEGAILYQGFFDAALPLFDNPAVFLVRGEIREINPARSIYLSAIDDWSAKQPINLEEALSGEGLFRKSTLLELNGFNPKLQRGDFLDLCYRAAANNYEAVSIDEKMELKALDIDTFSDFWKFFKAKGQSLRELNKLYETDRPPAFQKQISSLKKTALILFLIVAFLLFLLWQNVKAFLILPSLGLTLFISLKSYLQNTGSYYSHNSLTAKLFFQILAGFKQAALLLGFSKMK